MPPKPNPQISGTFTQGGKEYDASLFKTASGHVEAAVVCPEGHFMVPTSEGESEPLAPGRFTRVICLEEGCAYHGIMYRVTWPGVFLDAVADKEGD